MGLAGRKTKQRIGLDPRNLTWSDDSSKFGAKYLQSLGWTSGAGLGATGEGRTSNIKIHQKLDLMGIGANRRGPGEDDVGWRGGREFEGLLARLNQAQHQDHPGFNETSTPAHNTAVVKETSVSMALEGTNGQETGVDAHGMRNADADVTEKKKRKRSTIDDGEMDDGEVKRRKEKEKRDRKDRKKAEKATKKLESHQVFENQESMALTPDVLKPIAAQSMEPVAKVAPRYRAHRARHLASKRLAAASETGMNEILGISPSIASAETSARSSILFPTQAIPLGQESGTDDASQNGNPIRMAGVKQADDTDVSQISAIGLGSQHLYGGDLGLRGEKDESATKATQSAGDNLLRKSEKSVANYFAEKLRMKNASVAARR